MGVAMQRYEVCGGRSVVQGRAELRYGGFPALQTPWLHCNHLHLELHTQVSTQKHRCVFVTASSSLFCFCSQEQPSYLLLVPRSLQPGVQTSISVTILSSSPVHVSANMTHGDQVVALNSTIVKGGQSCRASQTR